MLLLLLLLLLNAIAVRVRSRFVFDGARDEKGYNTLYYVCQQPPRQKDCRWGGGGTEKKLKYSVYMRTGYKINTSRVYY